MLSCRSTADNFAGPSLLFFISLVSLPVKATNAMHQSVLRKFEPFSKSWFTSIGKLWPAMYNSAQYLNKSELGSSLSHWAVKTN